MTINSTGNRVSYSGNGATTAFSFPYPFSANGDLVVLLVNASTGASTPQTITTNYTVAGAGGSSGTVTMLVAPPTGYSLVIYRDPALTQAYSFVDNDPLPAASVNGGFDKLTMIAQRLRDLVSRTLYLPDSDPATAVPVLPNAVSRANKVLAFDASGNPIASTTDAANVTAAQTAATSAAASAAAAAASTSAAGLPASLTGKALNFLRVLAGETGYEHRTPTQVRSDISAAASGSNSDITALTGLTSSLIRSGTAVASTSGTAIDFTSIPSWVKRITVEFNGVSLSSASLPLVQIGTSGGVETTGYKAAVSWITGNLNSTAGIPMGLTGGGTANTFHGALVFTTLGSNVWVAQGALAIADANGGCSFSAGSKTLAGTLDRVRITTVSGTDTFDAGSVNILYE